MLFFISAVGRTFPAGGCLFSSHFRTFCDPALLSSAQLSNATAAPVLQKANAARYRRRRPHIRANYFFLPLPLVFSVPLLAGTPNSVNNAGAGKTSCMIQRM